MENSDPLSNSGEERRQKPWLRRHFSAGFAFSEDVLFIFVLVPRVNGCLCGAKERVKLRGETGGEINRRREYGQGKRERRRGEESERHAGEKAGVGGDRRLASECGGWGGNWKAWASSVPSLVPGGERSPPHRLHHCCFHNREPSQRPKHHAAQQQSSTSNENKEGGASVKCITKRAQQKPKCAVHYNSIHKRLLYLLVNSLSSFLIQ